MEWRHVVLVFQIIRYKCIGVFDTIDEVRTALNHTLVNELLERLFLHAYTEVEEEFVPETGVDQVTRRMFRTADIQIDVLPIFVRLFRYQRLVVVRIHIAEVISRRTGKARHGIQFEREDGLIINQTILYHFAFLYVPSPFCRMTQWRFSALGRFELAYLRQFERELVFINHIRHAILVVNRKRFAPITLAREDGIAQTIIHLDASQVMFLDVFLRSRDGFFNGQSIQI